jgi:hypothetical protein
LGREVLSFRVERAHSKGEIHTTEGGGGRDADITRQLADTLQKLAVRRMLLISLVELRGIEPLTS